MVWQSIISGLAVYLHWETWVALVLMFAVVSLPKLFLGSNFSLFKTAAHDVGWQRGCLPVLAEMFFILISTAVLLAILHPIIFGLDNHAAWSLPFVLTFSKPIIGLKLMAFITIGTVCGQLIPVLRNLQAFSVLCSGGPGLYYIAVAVVEMNERTHSVPIFPGILLLAGVVVMSKIVTLAHVPIFALCANLCKVDSWIVLASLKFDESAVLPEEMGTYRKLIFARIVIDNTLGFIPIFIYGSWIGQQLRLP